MCPNASERSSLLIRAPVPNCLSGVIARSSESQVHVNKSLGIPSLTERPVGHDKSCIIRHLTGAECFLGIAPKGEPVKFSKGGVRNGPTLRLPSLYIEHVHARPTKFVVGKFNSSSDCAETISISYLVHTWSHKSKESTRHLHLGQIKRQRNPRTHHLRQLGRISQVNDGVWRHR